MRKNIFYICFILFLSVNSVHAQETRNENKSAIHSDLRLELLNMKMNDQQARGRLVEFIRESGSQINLTEFENIKKKIDSLDVINTCRLNEIFNKYGWPGPNLVGEDGAKAAFLLLQHADLQTQKRFLPLIRDAFQNGGIEGESLALIIDRILVEEGKPQIYGTQAEIRNNKVIFYTLQDSANVDQRRDSLGLPPLSKYVEMLRETYMKQ